MSATEAADRYFRAYSAHLTAPDADTLFNLLNALHSFNDRLKAATKVTFHGLGEFAALKALRNLFHHETELLSQVRIAAAKDLAPLLTDLMHLCLIERDLAETALAGIQEKWKAHDEPLARKALKWYGNVVNINPCIFNFSVHAFETVSRLELPLKSEPFLQMQAAYEAEDEAGVSHFVTGDIVTRAGDVASVLATLFSDLPSRRSRPK